MKRSGLKTGMWLELRNGELTMVLLGTKNGDIVSSEGSWAPLDNYSNDLKHECVKSADVVAIYQPSNNRDYYNFKESPDKKQFIIWEENKNEKALKELTTRMDNIQTQIESLNKEFSKCRRELNGLHK